MARKLLDSNGMFIGCIDAVRKFIDGRTLVYLSSGPMLEFGPGDLTAYCNGYLQIIKYGSFHRDMTDNTCYATEAKKILNEVFTMSAATIKNVIFSPPATIVYWSDDTKTVVKCSSNDVFDPEKSLAMAIAKRCGGNKGSYYTEIREWVEKSGKKYPKKSVPDDDPGNLDVLKKYITEADRDFKELINACMNGEQAKVLFKIGALAADLEILKTEINK